MSELVLDKTQETWTPKQKAALVALGMADASPAEMAVFYHVTQQTGLDPFARQIYMIKYGGKPTIQVGIDGARLVARRACDAAKEPLSISAPEWCGPDGVWRDAWLSPEPPAAARCTVTRGLGEFGAVALMAEYNNNNSMWRSRPAGQLAKCAEALALRKACPQDLAGVHVDAEMDRAANEQPRSRMTPAEPPAEVVEGELVEDNFTTTTKE